LTKNTMLVMVLERLVEAAGEMVLEAKVTTIQ
jgi:hypothetical protein